MHSVYLSGEIRIHSILSIGIATLISHCAFVMGGCIIFLSDQV